MNHFKTMVTKKSFFFTFLVASISIAIFFIFANFTRNKDEVFIIPIDDFLHDMPVVSVLMNNQPIKLFIDFSGKEVFSTLNETKLKKIYAKKLKTAQRFTDSLGKIFITQNYRIDSLKIGKKTFHDVTISEDTNWGFSSGPLPREFEIISGKLCLDIFQKYNLIYDFAEKKIVAYTGDQFPKPYDEINLKKVDSKINSSGVQILLTLKNQKKWFAVDT